MIKLSFFSRKQFLLDPPIIEQPKPKIQQQKIQRPSSIQTYSDEFENATSTRSSTPIKQKTIPEKPRVIQQPISSKFCV